MLSTVAFTISIKCQYFQNRILLFSIEDWTRYSCLEILSKTSTYLLNTELKHSWNHFKVSKQSTHLVRLYSTIAKKIRNESTEARMMSSMLKVFLISLAAKMEMESRFPISPKMPTISVKTPSIHMVKPVIKAPSSGLCNYMEKNSTCFVS